MALQHNDHLDPNSALTSSPMDFFKDHAQPPTPLHLQITPGLGSSIVSLYPRLKTFLFSSRDARADAEFATDENEDIWMITIADDRFGRIIPSKYTFEKLNLVVVKEEEDEESKCDENGERMVHGDIDQPIYHDVKRQSGILEVVEVWNKCDVLVLQVGEAEARMRRMRSRRRWWIG